MSVRPGKIRISLGIRPVWSESSLSAWKNLGSLATYWVQSEDWSDWTDAQPDLSLRWTHERGGSVVECRNPEREVGDSKPTAAVLCPWARHFTPRKYWLITQVAVAPSRHDWKIVDWDVKPQHKHTHKHSFRWFCHVAAQIIHCSSVPGKGSFYTVFFLSFTETVQSPQTDNPGTITTDKPGDDSSFKQRLENIESEMVSLNLSVEEINRQLDNLTAARTNELNAEKLATMISSLTSVVARINAKLNPDKNTQSLGDKAEEKTENRSEQELQDTQTAPASNTGYFFFFIKGPFTFNHQILLLIYFLMVNALYEGLGVVYW